MIKILHTGDIHLGSLTGPEKNGINLRREDTLRCMDEIVQTAREERPDLTIIAGDLFNRSRVWADTALDDVRDAVERLLRPLCECSGHVVLLFGTANHDNPKAFENIFTVTNDLDNLNVDTAPALYRLRCNDGSWVQIMSVPGFDKGRLRTFCPGMDKEAENFNATALINDTIMGLAGRCDKSIPTILTAHYTVAGAEADNGSTFLAGQDVVVLPATIDAAGVDLACLGHIHRPQKIACNTPAYYCGCINELKLRSTASQVTMWCGIIALHQEDGIGKDRLNKLTQGIMEAENAAALQIVELGMAEASRRLQREMHGICEISFHVPYVKRPKKHQELKDQMEKDAAATFGWLVLAKAMHKTYGYGKDRLARLYKNTQENYRQFVVWYAEDESWAYEKLRQCIARALQEEIVVVPDDYGELTFTLASEQQEVARQIKTQVFNEMARRNSKKQVCPLLSENEMQRRCREVQKQIFGGMN